MAKSLFSKILQPLKRARQQINIRHMSQKPTDPPNPQSLGKNYKDYAVIAATTTAIMFSLYHFKESIIDTIENNAFESFGANETLRQKFNFIDKVVKNCAPSVVFIEIKDSVKIDPETNQPQTVSNGSGFIVREDGYILTNAHVVISKPRSHVIVMMNDGTSYNATVEDADMNIDLALLKINANKTLPYLKMGNSEDVNTGEWVVALGSPLSLSHSVTAGVISSVNREAEELGLKNFSMHYIQTDAAITFGNSGGPLVNLDGDVIGINNLRVTAGISFAIPADYAKKFLDRCLAQNGIQRLNLSRKKLGITTISVTPQIIGDLKSNLPANLPGSITHGVLVWKIANGTPASISDLLEGDIITHVNDFPVHEVSDIYACVLNNTWKLKLKIIRNGEDKEIIVKSLFNRDSLWSNIFTHGDYFSN